MMSKIDPETLVKASLAKDPFEVVPMAEVKHFAILDS